MGKFCKRNIGIAYTPTYSDPRDWNFHLSPMRWNYFLSTQVTYWIDGRSDGKSLTFRDYQNRPINYTNFLSSTVLKGESCLEVNSYPSSTILRFKMLTIHSPLTITGFCITSEYRRFFWSAKYIRECNYKHELLRLWRYGKSNLFELLVHYIFWLCLKYLSNEVKVIFIAPCSFAFPGGKLYIVSSVSKYTKYFAEKREEKRI